MSFTNATFAQQLRFGMIAESAIATWMRRRGWSVLPAYEKEIDSGKGPRLFTPNQALISPDMLAFQGVRVYWVEAKHKTAFTWHRKTSCWTTGIDLRHYKDYCKVADESPWPVWLLFLQRGGHAKDSPETSPCGLYGNSIDYLREHESHRWDSVGMVYWSIDSLRLLTTMEEMATPATPAMPCTIPPEKIAARTDRTAASTYTPSAFYRRLRAAQGRGSGE